MEGGKVGESCRGKMSLEMKYTTDSEGDSRLTLMTLLEICEELGKPFTW